LLLLQEDEVFEKKRENKDEEFFDHTRFDKITMDYGHEDNISNELLEITRFRWIHFDSHRSRQRYQGDPENQFEVKVRVSVLISSANFTQLKHDSQRHI
jgi:hypothetical protein